MERWRVVPLTYGPAAQQVALSEDLAGSVALEGGPPTVRWYGYRPPAVVLGVGQAPDVVDRGAAAGAGYDVVRRRSGGAAVLASPSFLALDVAVPAGHPGAGADVLEAYRWVGEAFRAALAALLPGDRDAGRLGLVTIAAARADRATQREAPADTGGALRGLACFGTLSPYEVAVSGGPGLPQRKLVGLSQVRRRGVVLYQAGLYGTVDGAGLAGLLALPEGERRTLAAELPRRVAGMDELPAPPDWRPALMAAVTERLTVPAPSP